MSSRLPWPDAMRRTAQLHALLRGLNQIIKTAERYPVVAAEFMTARDLEGLTVIRDKIAAAISDMKEGSFTAKAVSIEK